MATNTNTTALDAENAGAANTYQNPNVNQATSQGVGSAGATGTTATHSGVSTGANTGVTTRTVGGGDAPTTHSGGVGQQIKGAFAQGHGVGEVLRGKFNSAVDTMAGDKEGQAKNKNIATGGEREFAGKDFVKKGTLDKAL